MELQQHFQKIPVLFSRSDLDIMLNSIKECEYYFHDPTWKAYFKARDSLILAMLFFTGCRPNEVLGLRYSDFNLKNMTFIIRGCNNKEKKDRIGVLVKELVPFFEEYFKYRKNSEWLFPSFECPARHLSSQRWKGILREKILKPSGLWIKPVDNEMVRTRSYSFRASFATRMLERSNGNAQMVASLMGHRDLRPINRYVYLNQFNENKLGYIRKLMGDK